MMSTPHIAAPPNPSGKPALRLPATHELILANRFELSGDGVQVLLHTASASGAPQLSYRDETFHQVFKGRQIRLEESSLGRLISVTLQEVPEVHTVNFTLVLPYVLVPMDGSGVDLATSGLLSIADAGRHLRSTPGPIHRHETLSLRGIARAVIF